MNIKTIYILISQHLNILCFISIQRKVQPAGQGVDQEVRDVRVQAPSLYVRILFIPPPILLMLSLLCSLHPLLSLFPFIPVPMCPFGTEVQVATTTVNIASDVKPFLCIQPLHFIFNRAVNMCPKSLSVRAKHV